MDNKEARLTESEIYDILRAMGFGCELVITPKVETSPIKEAILKAVMEYRFNKEDPSKDHDFAVILISSVKWFFQFGINKNNKIVITIGNISEYKYFFYDKFL